MALGVLVYTRQYRLTWCRASLNWDAHLSLHLSFTVAFPGAEETHGEELERLWDETVSWPRILIRIRGSNWDALRSVLTTDQILSLTRTTCSMGAGQLSDPRNGANGRAGSEEGEFTFFYLPCFNFLLFCLALCSPSRFLCTMSPLLFSDSVLHPSSFRSLPPSYPHSFSLFAKK